MIIRVQVLDPQRPGINGWLPKEGVSRKFRRPVRNAKASRFCARGSHGGFWADGKGAGPLADEEATLLGGTAAGAIQQTTSRWKTEGSSCTQGPLSRQIVLAATDDCIMI